ncbi:F390 synthetase-related protein [Algirhabdus cladophorae]|uniref:F390 synthetase-related protein n=1 Tax=Algirhabdus cladophorae TaxID=3377108 RepID=UPI003B8482A3
MRILHALRSYLRLRWFPTWIRSRADLQRWQSKKLRHWMQHSLPNVAAFEHPTSLQDIPTMDKASLMADFSRYTTPPISNAEGWQAFDTTKTLGPLIVGASTGTSGNRGLFAISQAERYAWLGAILAKLMPGFWRRRERIAILLPLNTPLYDSANSLWGLSLQFFDLARPWDELCPDLEGFDPTTIIAPPRILRRCVEEQVKIRPQRAFSGAEKLDPLDRNSIEAGWDLTLHEIYMATEGLLGTTCQMGRMHLAEDCLYFEFQPASGGLVMPILTDFSRSTQIMARYRLDDLLRLDPAPCACGLPTQVVHEIVGRQDDVFCLGSATGIIEVTPDILRNAIVDTDRRITQFQLVQTGPNEIDLRLLEDLPPDVADNVAQNLRALFRTHGAQDLTINHSPLDLNQPGKLRRIRRDWQPDHTVDQKDVHGLL